MSGYISYAVNEENLEKTMKEVYLAKNRVNKVRGGLENDILLRRSPFWA